MGADFRADAVLERGDDLAASRVVLRVGGENQAEVDREAQRVAFHLDVALLHDVEQAHLDLGGQVGELVDGKDAAMGAGQQAVVDGELVGQGQAAPGRLDGVDVADDVGDGDVRGGQLLHVAALARQPDDRGGLALLLHLQPAGPAEGLERVVVDGAAGDHGGSFVQEICQRAQDAALGLPAQAQQDEVVPGQDGVDDLRSHAVLVAHDAGKELLSPLQLRQQVLPHFLLHRAAGLLRAVAARA